jgi:chromate transporter
MTSPSLQDLTRAFLRIGFLSFGGPAAQIAMMHRDIVDDRKWVGEKDFLSALSFCMLLPGPEAMQLATWIGWRTHGTIGGLIAGGLFVLPGAMIVLALSMIYAAFGGVPLVAALFAGVQAAVIAVALEALFRVARRALKGRALRIVALLSFLALFLFALPYPLIILAAAIWGYASTKRAAPSPILGPAPWRETLQAVVIWGAVWLLPLGLLLLSGGILADIARFFSKLALLTFGGAYAVLAWMAQDVVAVKGWLTLRQMMDGLGFAETTPGPLILVTQFVGYMAAHGLGGWLLGIAGAATALWMTFAPCFLWIFAGAPWIQRLTAAPRLSGAFGGITAAVVGVIGYLALWFALNVLFDSTTLLSLGPIHLTLPDLTSLRPLFAGIAALCIYLLLVRHWNLIAVLAIAAAISAISTTLLP